MSAMARPRKPMAQKVAEGAHISKAAKQKGLESEVYASDGAIEPPPYLNGPSLAHFRKVARYMMRKNAMAKADIYGEIDAEALAMACVSYQKPLDALQEEKDADSSEDMARAQRKRISENKNYREFMTKLQLDPSNRFIVNANDGDDDAGSEYDDV